MVQTNQTAASLAHTYAVAGNYQVRISGLYPRIYLYSNATHAAKLRSVDQWGDIVW